MPAKPAALSLSNVLGLGRIAADGAMGLTGLVEHMHNSILGKLEAAATCSADDPDLEPCEAGQTDPSDGRLVRRRASSSPAMGKLPVSKKVRRVRALPIGVAETGGWRQSRLPSGLNPAFSLEN